MFRVIKSNNALILITLIALILNGCTTNQPNSFTSETQRNLAELFKSNDEHELELRFGQLSKAVNQSWIKTWKNGDARALKFSWIVPGVTMLMKEVWWSNTSPPEFKDHVLEWSPYTNRISWSSMIEKNTNFPKFNSIENYSASVQSHGQYDGIKGIPYFSFDETKNVITHLGTTYSKDHSNLTDAQLKFFIAKNLEKPYSPSTSVNKQMTNTLITSDGIANQERELQAEHEAKAENFAKLYSALKINKPKSGTLKLNSKTKEVKPEIYLFDAESAQRVEINVSSKSFTPSIAVHQFDTDRSVGSIPRSDSVSSHFYFADKGLYLVLVTSLNKNKGGNYKIALKEIAE